MNIFRLAILAAPIALAACSGNPAAPAASSSEPAAPPAAEAPAAKPAKAVDNAALEPLFGKWAVDLAQCNATGAGPITISATRFEGAENGCDITSFSDGGNGNFLAAVSCNAQGKASTENIQMRPIFAPTGEGIDMVYLDRGKQAFTVLRCKSAATN
ncbi:MAG: hypothetical protein ABIO40_01985 [Devosia sp.]